MVQILTEPKNALVKQYQKLMEYDGGGGIKPRRRGGGGERGGGGGSGPVACGPSWRRS